MPTGTTTTKRRATKRQKITRTQTQFRFDVALADGQHHQGTVSVSDPNAALRQVQKVIGPNFTDVTMKDQKDGNWLIFSPSVQDALGMFTPDSPIGYISKDNIPVNVAVADVVENLGYREQDADQGDFDDFLSSLDEDAGDDDIGL